ncbi:MAG: dihydroorotase family protein [Candidatus Micrarchaeota archaeon]|nr:dihydroorotase family protein [Candidatus Micrarchaeota archaeon]
MFIRNCRLVTPSGIVRASIEFEGERILRVGTFSASSDSLDAHGMYVFPGIIDAHAHLRDPEAPHKEDFTTGTRAAIAGGVTTVIDMPSYKPATTSKKLLEEKLAIANKKAVCDFGLRFGASDKNFDEAKATNSNSLKFFLSETKSELTLANPSSIEKHFRNFPKNKPICVHCEDQRIIDLNGGIARSMENHHLIRSVTASAFGLAKILSSWNSERRRVHVCHVSTALELQLLRKKHPSITFEFTPHHLFLSTRDVAKLGNFAKTNPPIRPLSEVAALWEGLQNADIIASDHAPHTREEKENDYASAPSGVPGLETMFPLFFDAAMRGKIPLPRLAQLMCANPAKIFGVKGKGEIKKGYYADFAIIDPRERWTVKGDSLQTKCKWSPFEGKQLRGKIKYVFVRGKMVFEDGNMLSKPGFGKEVC